MFLEATRCPQAAASQRATVLPCRAFAPPHEEEPIAYLRVDLIQKQVLFCMRQKAAFPGGHVS